MSDLHEAFLEISKTNPLIMARAESNRLARAKEIVEADEAFQFDEINRNRFMHTRIAMDNQRRAERLLASRKLNQNGGVYEDIQ